MPVIGSDSRLSKEFILSKISQQDIFEKYLGISISDKLSGKMFCNPLRYDPLPTCTFKIINNQIKFSDWADTKVLDCFALVQKIGGDCTFKEALQLIAHHFHLLEGKDETDLKYVLNPDKILSLYQSQHKDIQIRIKRTEWTKKHIDFWNLYNLNIEDLEEIYPIKCYWINENKFIPRDIAFAYHFGEYNYKIYIPYAKRELRELKHIHNNANIFQGDLQLKYDKDLLIITSSYKDVELLRKIEREYTLNYEVVAPMSETTLPRQKLEEYKLKYKNIILYHNNDKAGLKSMKVQSEQHNLDYIFNPINLPKDISDISKELGYEIAVETIHNLLYE